MELDFLSRENCISLTGRIEFSSRENWISPQVTIVFLLQEEWINLSKGGGNEGVFQGTLRNLYFLTAIRFFLAKKKTRYFTIFFLPNSSVLSYNFI